MALRGDLDEGIRLSEQLYQEVGGSLKELGKAAEPILAATLVNMGVMKFEKFKAMNELISSEEDTTEEF